jgi:hypothetical protein
MSSSPVLDNRTSPATQYPTARLTQDGQHDHKSIPESHSASPFVGLDFHHFASPSGFVSVRMVQVVVGSGLPSCLVGLVEPASPF